MAKNSGLKRLYTIFSKAGPGAARYFYIGLAFLGFVWYAIYTNFIIMKGFLGRMD